MKIFKIILTILCLTIFVNAENTISDNEVLKTIYEKVILANSKKATYDISELKKALEEKDITKSKELFKKVITSWKSVQSSYILGELNEDYIDTPRLIDIYHHGNEDIKLQLDRAIQSEDDIKIVLFKNSLKSINALEYILYKKDISNNRINDIALAITKRIQSHLNDINEEYKNQEANFLSDLKKANSILINQLNQNTYKLKEWRLGDTIGLSKKYENNPNNERAEYYTSKNSSLAINAILTTYKNIFDSNQYLDYGDYLKTLTQEDQIEEFRETINKAMKLNIKINNDDFSKAKELFEEANKIHVILFLDLIEELSINAKIIEADGD